MPASRISAAARRPLRTFYFISFLVLGMAACTDEGPDNAASRRTTETDTAVAITDTSTGKPAPAADSTTAPAGDTTAGLMPPQPGGRYYFIHPKDSAGKAFLISLSPEQLTIVYALNRVDAGPARRTDTLVIPTEWAADLMAYSPYPAEVPALAGVKKIIFFSYPIQAFGVYENGRLIRWGPTSMGKKSTPTPTGLFFSNWKSKETISTVDDDWVLKWNFNVSNKGGVGWHQYQMPGYPASHSCMRLFEYDARWLYDWADQWRLTPDRGSVLLKGTSCVIFGQYAFGSLKPWRHLPADGAANDISPDALAAEVQGFMDKILEAQAARDAAPAAMAKNTGADSNRTSAPVVP